MGCPFFICVSGENIRHLQGRGCVGFLLLYTYDPKGSVYGCAFAIVIIET